MFRENLISKSHPLCDNACLILNQIVSSDYRCNLYLLFDDNYEDKVKFDLPPPFNIQRNGVTIIRILDYAICIYNYYNHTKAIEFAANNLGKNILDEVIMSDEDIKEAVKRSYLNTDSDFMKKDLHGGSCFVTTLMRNGNLIVSNASDCRAVLSTGGVAESLTSDQRPSREDERDRIKTLSGYVDLCRGVGRIQGSLAVSRMTIIIPKTHVFDPGLHLSLHNGSVNFTTMMKTIR